MKLIIFGATGGTGRQLLKQALELGHDVTAYTRHPEKLKKLHNKLKIVPGDVLDLNSVSRAIQLQNAVLCALGAPAMNKTMLRTYGIQNIIHAMQEAGLRRLVCESALGVGNSREMLPFHYKYLIAPLLLRHVFADHEAQENHIKKSKLDWIIVRPAALNDGSQTGAYRHGFSKTDKPVQLKISRADVAGFMLKQLTNDAYLHQSPGVSD